MFPVAISLSGVGPSHHEPRITEHAETVTLFGFKYPLEIASAVSGKFQEEFLFMTPMRNLSC
jgi:hypothetical protein